MSDSLFSLQRFLKRDRLRHWYFPANFTKFTITPFLQNTSGRLRLSFSVYCQIKATFNMAKKLMHFLAFSVLSILQERIDFKDLQMLPVKC